MDILTLKKAQRHTNEQVIQKATNSPTQTVSFDGGVYSLPSNVVNGQVSDVRIKGQTWTNLAGAGDTSPQTVENLDAAKTYLLINSEGANVTIDTVDTPTPVKLTGATSFDFGWASGEIALYELSTEEATLEASILGQKYHYVSGTKSTISAMRLKSVGKNLFDGKVIYGMIYGVNGDIASSTTRLISDLYIIPDGISVTISVKAGYIAQLFGWDKNDNYLGYTPSPQNINTLTFPNLKKVRLQVRKEPETTIQPTDIIDMDVQLEYGSSATTYEPYKESIAYINLPEGEELRSLLNGVKNGVKDEVNVSTGVKTQRNKEIVLQSSDVRAIDTQYENLDRIRISKPTDSVDMGKVSSTRWSRLGDYPYKSVSVTDDIANVGFYCDSPPGIPNEIALYVQKGQFTNLTEVKNALTGTTLIYQLATPIVTKLPAQAPLQVYENGTVYVEPLGDPSETTVPSVEMTIPTGTSNKFGVASHDYDGAAADWVLTNSESKCFLLAVSNAGGSANIIAPNRPGTMYAISNASGQTVTVKISGGTGVAITNAKTVLVIHNGTDYTALTAEL